MSRTLTDDDIKSFKQLSLEKDPNNTTTIYQGSFPTTFGEGLYVSKSTPVISMETITGFCRMYFDVFASRVFNAARLDPSSIDKKLLDANTVATESVVPLLGLSSETQDVIVAWFRDESLNEPYSNEFVSAAAMAVKSESNAVNLLVFFPTPK